MTYLDLTIPEHAYFFGFLQTDGHVYEGTQNRSKITIEIKHIDKNIIDKIHKMLPLKTSIYERKATTNFGYLHSVGLRICNRQFTDEIKLLGIPAGKKSHLINIPTVSFSEADYFRGLIDGDGSVGQDKNGRPFVGFVTKSLELAKNYNKFISKLTGGNFSNLKPNTRDQIYNITVFCEHAQTIMKYLYYNNCFCLNRKKEKVDTALLWIRPNGITRVANKQKWTKEHDQIIMNNDLETSMKLLDRSKQSILTRKWRLII